MARRAFRLAVEEGCSYCSSMCTVPGMFGSSWLAKR